MNLIEIFQRFPDQESCIAHLESKRWGDTPACPLCKSLHVARKKENERVGRWNCHDCHASFNVLSGTIFQKTRVPLQKWFLGIGLMLNAKKSLSSYQLARDLDLNQKTAWYLMMRVRDAMDDDGETRLLWGIVEMDETYIGGRPRKGNKPRSTGKSKRGRGTNKMPVIGAVERDGRAVARPSDNVSQFTLRSFIKEQVDPRATLVTDNFSGYWGVSEFHESHLVVDHTVEYVSGIAHTNSVECLWSQVKRAWYGQHHHYSRTHAAMYIAEAVYKWNERHATDLFDRFIRRSVRVQA